MYIYIYLCEEKRHWNGENNGGKKIKNKKTTKFFWELDKYDYDRNSVK